MSLRQLLCTNCNPTYMVLQAGIWNMRYALLAISVRMLPSRLVRSRTCNEVIEGYMEPGFLPQADSTRAGWGS